MNFFPTAFADDVAQGASQAPAPAADFTMLIILVVGFLFFYLIVLRPQNKKRKEAQQVINQITVGDEVLTNGGIIGRVIKESEDKSILSIQINENNVIMIKRAYVVTALPKGTFEQFQAPKK